MAVGGNQKNLAGLEIQKAADYTFETIRILPADKTHIERNHNRLLAVVGEIERTRVNVVSNGFTARASVPAAETHHSGAPGRIHADSGETRSHPS